MNAYRQYLEKHSEREFLKYFSKSTFFNPTDFNKPFTFKSFLRTNLEILFKQLASHFFYAITSLLFLITVTLAIPFLIAQQGFVRTIKNYAKHLLDPLTHIIVAPLANILQLFLHNFVYTPIKLFRQSEQPSVTPLTNEQVEPQLMLPKSLQNFQKHNLQISIENSGFFMWNTEAIQTKFDKGTVTNIIKLDYDGVITSLNAHCSNLKGLGLDALFNDSLIDISDKEKIKQIIRLTLKDDTLVIISSNNPFGYTIFNTIYKLFEKDIDRDLILKHLPITCGTPQSICQLKDLPPENTLLNPKSFTEAWRGYRNSHLPRNQINKSEIFSYFLTLINLPITQKINLFTVDDKCKEIRKDINLFSDDDRFDYQTEESDVVFDNQFPENVLALLPRIEPAQHKTATPVKLSQSSSSFIANLGQEVKPTLSSEEAKVLAEAFSKP